MDHTQHPVTTERPEPFNPLTNDQIELMAKLAYNAAAEPLGKPFFEALPEVEQASILAFAIHAYQQLMGHGEPDPAYMHNNKLSALLRDGWQLADYFDVTKKFTPLLKAWEEMDDTHKQGPVKFLDAFKQGFELLQAGGSLAEFGTLTPVKGEPDTPDTPASQSEPEPQPETPVKKTKSKK